MAKKADIITGAVVGFAALIAPIGYVLVEATTKPAKQPKVVVKDRKPAPKAIVETPKFESVVLHEQGAVPIAPTRDDESPSARSNGVGFATPSGVQQVALAPGMTVPALQADWFAGQGGTAPLKRPSEPLDADHEDPVAPNVSESMRAALAEVGLSSKVTETVADAIIEPPSAEELALADISKGPDAAAMTPMPDEELSEEDRRIAAEFDQKVAAGKVTVVPAIEKKATPEAKADESKRSKVTVVRPKGSTVHSVEPFLIKVTAKGFPIMLVRPREAGSPWYAQETLPKQGTYIQARGRFGNANTPEGSPFRVMVAFVPRIEDIPDNGAEIKAFPENWVLSQEMIVTLKRN